ncbi:unnamed protein product [Protopolystoma xenopodis]|uniref:Uncharacterized protein n=1 Tax=Protopolystoma xenopodis TaxID=117903 RepID=A0A3S5ANW9_9PLAT|nr:unnamed protein product [Protopolystoma xenopodis]
MRYAPISDGGAAGEVQDATQASKTLFVREASLHLLTGPDWEVGMGERGYVRRVVCKPGAVFALGGVNLSYICLVGV